MKLSSHRNVKDSIPAEKVANYRIDDSAVVHITRILRNMYEDPIKAVVREYLANSVDAHNEIGQTKPIEVNSPTRLKPMFSCRDFGPGLSLESVEVYLFGFGASGQHKRMSNEQIGGFGIGCKCGFAISDSFTYTSWHDGKKQVWLCQLDDNDMGEAKLISHEASDEPSGIMIEIPVANNQVSLFERHLGEVPMFFSQPLKINGKLKDPRNTRKVTTSGQLKGDFSRTSWEIFTLNKDSDFGKDVSLSDTIIVQMGDLWYPVDMQHIFKNDEEKRKSRLIQVMNGRTQYYGSTHSGKYCVFKAPIGSFSLAPTRENLQYDGMTRKALQLIVKEIEDNFQKIAQEEIDKIDDVWEASEKSLELQDSLMYRTDQLPVNDKGVIKPAFHWKGQLIQYDKQFAIDIADTTGAKLFMGTRDLKTGSVRWYGHRGAPTTGQLKVSVRRMNEAQTYVQGSPYYGDKTLNCTNEKSVLSLLGKDQQSVLFDNEWINSKNPIIAVYGDDVKQGSDVMCFEKYIVPNPLPVYTLDPKWNCEYQIRRFLISVDSHAPKKDAYVLVVQGTEDERNAFFKKYPWLNHDVKPLPIIKAVRTGGSSVKGNQSGRSLKTLQNMYVYNGKYNTKAGSNNWDSVHELPANKPLYYVHLDRFAPSALTPAQATNKTITPGAQLDWLISLKETAEFFLGKEIEVFGFRHVATSKAKIPDDAIFLPDVVDAELSKWMSPNTLSKYPVHGLHVMAYASTNGLYDTLGLNRMRYSCIIKKKENASNRRYYSSWNDTLHTQLLDALRNGYNSSVTGLDESSMFKQTAKLYFKLMGTNALSLNTAKQEKLSKAVGVLSRLKTKARYAVLRQDELICNFSDKFGKVVNSYMKPLQQSIDSVWDHYPMLPLVVEIPEKSKEAENRIINYIELVDKK